MPEIKLPEVRPRGGFREMRREDIQHAMSDIQHAMSDVHLPKVDLRSIEVPKGARRAVDLSKVDLSKVDLGKLDLSRLELPAALEGRLPAAIEDRIPHRKRRGRLRPLMMAWFVIGTAAWVVFASPLAPRIRAAIAGVRDRLGLGSGGMSGDDEFDIEVDVTSVGIYETPQGAGERDAVGVGPGVDQAATGETTLPGDTLSGETGTLYGGLRDEAGSESQPSTASAASNLGGSAADEYGTGTGTTPSGFETEPGETSEPGRGI